MDAVIADSFEPPSTRQALSTMRRTIGARLRESKQNAPHFYLSVDIELDAVLALRERLKESAVAEVPTVNDCVVAAVARALMEVPAINARFEDSHIRYFEYANVGVAVALDSGLVVPVIREASRKDLTMLGREMRTLAERARTRRLTPDDYRGGTFTVSNLGMFGIREFIAIVNPPQAAILALGQGVPRPVVRDGAIVAATVMTATLSADHRVVDGVVGARFLQALQSRLQVPAQLLDAPESSPGAGRFDQQASPTR
ncbi:MAG: dihydrolipoamide acetyltransferase family protein [Dehalococcoidia bacterium]